MSKNLLYSLPEDIKDIIVPITQRENLKTVHIDLSNNIASFHDHIQYELLSFRDTDKLIVSSRNYLVSYDYNHNRYIPMTFWKLPFHLFTDLEILTATCDIIHELIP